MNTAKSVGGYRRFQLRSNAIEIYGARSSESLFLAPKACMTLVEVCGVPFVHRKACRRLVEVGRVPFEHLKRYREA